MTANGNTGDLSDLGLGSQYINGSAQTIYTGFARIAADPLKRWVVFDGITAMPTTTISGLTSSNYSGLVVNDIFANAGSVSSPAITFNTSTNTGLYLQSPGIMSIATNGIETARFSATNTTITQNITFPQLTPYVNIPSISPAISTGQIYLQSLNATDQWIGLYSDTSQTIPAFSGTVYSSPVDNFFITNSASGLIVGYN